MKSIISRGANPFICPQFARGNFGNVVDFAVREHYGYKNRAKVSRDFKGKATKKNYLEEFRSVARQYHLRYLFSRILTDLIILFET